MKPLNKKRLTLKNPTLQKTTTYVCSELRKQVFKSGAEGIVITFQSPENKFVRKYDILKNKDGSTLQSQIDVLKKDLNIIDPCNSLDLQKLLSGVVLKIQNTTAYNLTFNTEGYVQSMIKTH